MPRRNDAGRARKDGVIEERIEDENARAQADAVFRQPSVIDAENTVLEIIAVLKDFGFDNQGIIELVKADGRFSKRLIKNDEAPEYIVAHHDHVYCEDFIGIIGRKHAILHMLLMCSDLAVVCDWHYKDNDVLGVVGRQLANRGMQLAFTPHGWDETFRVSVIRGTQRRSVDFRYPDRFHDLNALMRVVNALIGKYGLTYHRAGSCRGTFGFLLLDEERRTRLHNKYGAELEKILNGQ